MTPAPEATTDPTPSRRPRLATGLAVLAALVLVGGLVFGIWLRESNQTYETDEQNRLEAMQAAERFTETWNTFSADDVESYLEDVEPLLTTKFRSEFSDAAEDVVTGIEQQGLTSTGEVLVDKDGIPLVAVATIDHDSAEVLVVADANREVAGQEVLRHWRWQISLVKVDGSWLVDEFEEV